jgi:NAD(P)-dependent dehydrogenase (short-subunit alcohol dehydrogenase family)
VTWVLGDSANLADLDRLFETVKREKGHIDVLFASAGVADFVPLGEVSEESFDKQFDLNAKGTFFTVQKALPLLRDHASIIMTGTIATIKGMPNLSVYGASKAGLLVYAKVWTNELKSRGIRANVLSPGPIETGALKGREEVAKQMASLVPMGRIGQPEEIATTALFLASADSSFITGSEICVDGGMGQV